MRLQHICPTQGRLLFAHLPFALMYLLNHLLVSPQSAVCWAIRESAACSHVHHSLTPFRPCACPLTNKARGPRGQGHASGRKRSHPRGRLTGPGKGVCAGCGAWQLAGALRSQRGGPARGLRHAGGSPSSLTQPSRTHISCGQCRSPCKSGAPPAGCWETPCVGVELLYRHSMLWNRTRTSPSSQLLGHVCSAGLVGPRYCQLPSQRCGCVR